MASEPMEGLDRSEARKNVTFLCHGGDKEEEETEAKKCVDSDSTKGPSKKSLSEFFSLTAFGCAERRWVTASRGSGGERLNKWKHFLEREPLKQKKEEEDFEGGGSFFTQSHEEEATRREQEKEKETANK